VTRLALVNPIAPTQESQSSYNPPERATRTDSAALREMARLRETGGSREAICRQFWKASMGWFVGDPKARIDAAWCAVPNETADAALMWLGYLGSTSGFWDLTAAARAVTAPTLVMHGARDYWAPAGARLGNDDPRRASPVTGCRRASGPAEAIDVNGALAEFFAAAGPREQRRPALSNYVEVAGPPARPGGRGVAREVHDRFIIPLIGLGILPGSLSPSRYHNFEGRPMRRHTAPIALLATMLLAAAGAAGAQEPASEERPSGLPSKGRWTFNFDAGLGLFGFANSCTPTRPDRRATRDNWIESFTAGPVASLPSARASLRQDQRVGERIVAAPPPWWRGGVVLPGGRPPSGMALGTALGAENPRITGPGSTRSATA
jgi:hypothetical protein